MPLRGAAHKLKLDQPAGAGDDKAEKGRGENTPMAADNPLAPIPHPKRMPVLGNMLSLDTKAPVQGLAKLARDLGPIFWMDMMGQPIVFVSGFRLVDELCDEKRFDKAVRGALRRVRAIAGDGLFTADTQEPNWSKAHNILLAPFGGRAMQSYHPEMVDIAEQLCLKWARLNPDEEIDVVHDMTALTLDTIGLCGFDYRFNSFYRSDYHPFVDALVRSLETTMMTRGLPFEKVTLRERNKRMEEDVAFLNGMVDEIVEDRRRKGAVGESKDLLDAMLTGVDKATGETLDDVNIRYQINTFLIAGHETTSGLLSYTIYALLKHPEILRKCYEEVDRVFGADTSVTPTFQQVSQLSYVSQCLKESLRLWPPAPSFAVYPYEDTTIGGVYKLKKRSFIAILVGPLHRDPEVWGPNPDLFDPENFSREAERARPANAWKPFGNGQRACIGRGFAMHEAALALGMIQQRFKLVDHTNYQLDLKETLTVKPEGFKIRVRPREAADRAAHAPAAREAAPAAAAPAPARAPRAAARPGHETPLAILYGSNLGTAEEIAHRIAEVADANGFATVLEPADAMVGALPSAGGLVVVTASYNGAPPDNAAKFLAWLEGDLPADALKGLKYVVYGCGNSDWAATYQSVPRRIDALLEKHGASRIFERGEGDARGDLDSQFDAWFARLAPAAGAAFGIEVSAEEAPAEPLYAVSPARAPTTPASQSVQAQPMEVLRNVELQRPAEGEMRSTRHIELRLPEGMAYRAGDHLAVAPQNDRSLVARVARRFGFTPDDYVVLKAPPGRRPQLPVDEPVSVGRLLGQFVELQQPATRKQIALMLANTRCPNTAAALSAYVGDGPEAAAAYARDIFAPRVSVFELLQKYPACELPFHTFLELLPPMAPRYYSISSSPRVDPSICSITVGVVRGPARSGEGAFAGVCSNHLASCGEGDLVRASVRPTKAGFQLPEDPSVPLVMIGPGTGLAPFRGFLQERARLKAGGAALGPALLFFGCRHPDRDFLYRGELEAMAAEGIVDLHTAFSRYDGGKAYVQDKLAEQKEAVWSAIDGGGIVYVCGDGARMEPDVKRALMRIYSGKTGADEQAAAAWIDKLGVEARYVLDVWAGG